MVMRLPRWPGLAQRLRLILGWISCGADGPGRPERRFCLVWVRRAADAIRNPEPGHGHQKVPAPLENPELIQGEISRRPEAANNTTDVRQRTDSLQGELARITTRMRRLLDACQDEVMTLDELR